MAKQSSAAERVEIERVARERVELGREYQALWNRRDELWQLIAKQREKVEHVANSLGREPDYSSLEPIRAERERVTELARGRFFAARGADPDDLHKTMMMVALERGHSARAAALLAMSPARAESSRGLKQVDGERTAQRVTVDKQIQKGTDNLLRRLQALKARLQETEPKISAATAATLLAFVEDALMKVRGVSELLAQPDERDHVVDAICSVLADGPKSVAHVERVVSEREGASKLAIERARARAGCEVVRVKDSRGRVMRVNLRLHTAKSDTKPR